MRIRNWGIALFLIITLLCSSASGELEWDPVTPAQQLLKSYMLEANAFLEQNGEQSVNTLFELYQSFAVFGITQLSRAELPEDVEITVKLFYDSIDSLELRVSDLARFPVIAGAFLWALTPESVSPEEAMAVPTQRMKLAVDAPDNSYEEPVESLNGTRPRVYYAYYPNQYHDGVNWMQMTVIFPLQGFWDGYELQNNPVQTKAPDTTSDHDPDYEGYFSEDDYTHLEVFATATPEPESAAGEYDPYTFWD